MLHHYEGANHATDPLVCFFNSEMVKKLYLDVPNVVARRELHHFGRKQWQWAGYAGLGKALLL
jgi:hypothetical protein